MAAKAIENSETLLLNKLPKKNPNAYVTGLSGRFRVPVGRGKLKGKGLRIGTGDNAQTFAENTDVFWRVRWDFEPEKKDEKDKKKDKKKDETEDVGKKIPKGPHVNAQFGNSKFAFQLDESKFVEDETREIASQRTMAKIIKDFNDLVRYDDKLNKAKPDAEVNFDRAGGKDALIRKLKDSWKSIATSPC